MCDACVRSRTQREEAERLGISPMEINEIEQGRS
jgi:transcriptional regulator with XRE-family HTH domain